MGTIIIFKYDWICVLSHSLACSHFVIHSSYSFISIFWFFTFFSNTVKLEYWRTTDTNSNKTNLLFYQNIVLKKNKSLTSFTIHVEFFLFATQYV